MPEKRPNIASVGSRSVGTVRTGRCPTCGDAVSIRVPAVPVHQLNHERERAERAEAACRAFADELHGVVGILNTYDLHSECARVERLLADYSDVR